jgi:hypothetical protein
LNSGHGNQQVTSSGSLPQRGPDVQNLIQRSLSSQKKPSDSGMKLTTQSVNAARVPIKIKDQQDYSPHRQINFPFGQARNSGDQYKNTSRGRSMSKQQTIRDKDTPPPESVHAVHHSGIVPKNSEAIMIASSSMSSQRRSTVEEVAESPMKSSISQTNIRLEQARTESKTDNGTISVQKPVTSGLSSA